MIGPRAAAGNGTRAEIEAMLDEARRLEQLGVNWIAVDLPHRSRAEFIEQIEQLAELAGLAVPASAP
ncbi:hypothetical protein D3C83_229820 [compost metagenome]